MAGREPDDKAGGVEDREGAGGYSFVRKRPKRRTSQVVQRGPEVAPTTPPAPSPVDAGLALDDEEEDRIPTATAFPLEGGDEGDSRGLAKSREPGEFDPSSSLPEMGDDEDELDFSGLMDDTPAVPDDIAKALASSSVGSPESEGPRSSVTPEAQPAIPPEAFRPEVVEGSKAPEASPLTTARFAGAALDVTEPRPPRLTGPVAPSSFEDEVGATGEFDPMGGAAQPGELSEAFTTGEFDPFAEPMEPDPEPEASADLPVPPGGYDLYAEAPLTPPAPPAPIEMRRGRPDEVEFGEPAAFGGPGDERDLELPRRRPARERGGDASAANVDLAQFAAEMDQLAAELEAAVARRPETSAGHEAVLAAEPLVEPAPMVPEAPQAAQSASARPEPLPPIDLPEPRLGPPAAPEPRLGPPAAPEPRLGPPAAPVSVPREVQAAPDPAAARGRPHSGAWDPFQDDLFGEDDSLDDLQERLAGAPSVPPAAPQAACEEPAVEPVEEPFSAPPLASAELSSGLAPTMTGAHEALDLGDSVGAALEVDNSAMNLSSQKDSGTLWSGPALAEPLSSGELPASRSAEFSAEYDSPLRDDPEQLSAVREYFRTLDKTIRVLNLYEGKGKSAARALTTAYRELTELLDRHPRVILRVTPYEFLLANDPVYTTEEDKRGLTFQLFRDGVRELTLHRGVEEAELGGLLEVLRRTQRSDEDDSVTLLWQRNLKHIEYRAIDAFLEGVVDSGSSAAQVAIEELMVLASAPLHATRSCGGGEIRALKAIPEDLLADLAGELAEDDPAMLAEGLEGLSADLWRRAMWLCLRMAKTGEGSDTAVSKLLASVFEEMLREGRWQTLAAASEAVLEIQSSSRPGTGGPLTAALGHVCSGEALGRLGELLDVAQPPDFPAILAFLQLLPEEANTALLGILGRLPAGALEERLAKLLEARGIDLTTYHRGRLKSTNAGVVISALRSLSRLDGEAALEAIHGQLLHRNWRVVLAAIGSLDKRLERPTPELVGSLRSESHQVRDKALALLERLPTTDEAGAALLPVVLEEEHERWTDKQLGQATEILVRWGGPAVDPQLVQALTQSNPFRRRRIEDRRQQLFEAVQRVGGERALKVLERCLERKAPAAVHKGMALVRERLVRQLAQESSDG